MPFVDDDAEGKDDAPAESKPTRRPRRRRGEDASEKDEPATAPQRTEGGWGFEGGGGSSNTAPKAIQPDVLPEGRRVARQNHFEEDSTGIMIIPDLEDGADEDITTRVAMAPQNTSRRVQGLRELDDEIRHAVPSAADGLDMSVLTRDLVPLAMLQEDDAPWEFDALLQSVTQEFRQDWNREAAVAEILRKGLDGENADSGAGNSNTPAAALEKESRHARLAQSAASGRAQM